MSNEQNTPKTNPADQAPSMTEQQPRRSDQLSNEEIDQATGGLLPAVAPEK